jgi:hypothetical protein
MSIWRAENRPHFPSSLTGVIKNGLVGTTSTYFHVVPFLKRKLSGTPWQSSLPMVRERSDPSPACP